MRIFIASLVLFFSSPHCFGQNQSWQDSIAATYNLLNNKTFITLELQDTSGNVFNTATLLGKTIYVDFWFTACPPCLKEIPFAKQLQQYFAEDTNVVFLSICIENAEKKTAWKQMIKDKKLPGIQLFYARNRPQKVNLLREYFVTFPMYLLVNTKMKVIGYDAPRPSEIGWVHWAIEQSEKDITLAESYKMLLKNPKKVNFAISADGKIIKRKL